ncbi:hypothetical protein EZV62_002711 [Acer yangbiense]|uniref:RNase H type-1 domain-containing protein n=1 Tax=Acer yangbiense TaxID=1000413 RepID=A0A5C7IZX3_9ROSI|nr:hypothetical protein EZV62_002711 [Acer yangbiense]
MPQLLPHHITSCTWRPPSSLWIKVNIDGCSKGNPGAGACSGVFRDDKANFKGGFSLFIGHCTSFVAEMKAVIFAINIALEHGFRWRNSNKGHGKVRYRLYGFPWAIEVWAMEAVDTLIDEFGNRLQHTLPRMRRWTMYKRPQNCVKIISDIEANIRAGKVLEELKATDDEAGVDYWVGVNFDMFMGPQFIPLVEIKEKNELLDTGDDGDNGDDGDDGGDGGDGGDRGDGDDGAPIGFTPGYTPTLPEGMVDPPPPPHPPRSSYMQPPSPMSSRQEPRSRGGDRINDLLEAVKALPDLLEDVVKQEVSQLSGVLRGLMQEIRSTRGQNSNEAPLTNVRDQSLHVEQEAVGPSGEKAVDVNVSTEQKVAPSREKEVDEEGLLSGDVRHIDAYMSLLVKMMESDPDEHRHSYTKVKVDWNRIIEADNEVGFSFDALAHECSVDWIEYGCGNRPGWGQPWWLYTQDVMILDQTVFFGVADIHDQHRNYWLWRSALGT